MSLQINLLIIILSLIKQINCEWKKLQLSGVTGINNLAYHETVEYTTSTNVEMLIVYGGYDITTKTLNPNIYQINLQSKVITTLPQLNQIPRSRINFGICSIKQSTITYIYIHGGYCSFDKQTQCNDFYKYNLQTNEWTQLTTTLNRVQHNLLCDQQNQLIWLFGGIDNNTKLMNDLYQYNINTNVWIQSIYSIFKSVQRQLLLWDGQTTIIDILDYDDYIPNIDINPIYIDYTGLYDCSSMNSLLPLCRSHYTMVKKLNEQNIILIGGQDSSNNVIQDVWIYNISNRQWVQQNNNLIMGSNLLEYFSKQKGKLSNDEQFIMLFGGYNGKDTTSNNYAISLKNWRVSQLSIPQFTSEVAPNKKYGFSISSFSLGITFTGGCIDVDANGICVKDEDTLIAYILGQNDCILPATNHYQNLCLYGRMKCRDKFWGPKCDKILCPGTTCFFDINSFEETYCYQCTGKATCNDNGKCGTCNKTKMDINYVGDDCSIVDCKYNCQQTSTDSGQCIQQYPVSSCRCSFKRGADYCQQIFCLNECSNNGTCENGKCACNQNKQGTDCSIFAVNFLK